MKNIFKEIWQLGSIRGGELVRQKNAFFPLKVVVGFPFFVYRSDLKAVWRANHIRVPERNMGLCWN